MTELIANWCSRRLAQRRSRPAFSLIEVCVVMAVSVVVLGSATALLVGLHRWDQRFRDQGVRTEQLALLSETIRSDIRAATDVALSDRETLTVKGADERTIRYALTSAGCERTIRLGIEPIKQRDLYRVGADLHWQLEPPAGEATSATTVILERPSRDTPATLLFVAAIRGADLPPAVASPQSE